MGSKLYHGIQTQTHVPVLAGCSLQLAAVALAQRLEDWLVIRQTGHVSIKELVPFDPMKFLDPSIYLVTRTLKSWKDGKLSHHRLHVFFSNWEKQTKDWWLIDKPKHFEFPQLQTQVPGLHVHGRHCNRQGRGGKHVLPICHTHDQVEAPRITHCHRSLGDRGWIILLRLNLRPMHQTARILM